jgi:hypothetical protein
MSLLLVSLSLASLVAGWVVFPILARRSGLLQDVVPVAVQAGEARKRVALAALKDVELDHAAGKLDDADYQEMRGLLEVEALQALASANDTDPPPGDAAGGVHACGFSNSRGSRFCAGCGQLLP